jgi:hypothetical protein
LVNLGSAASGTMPGDAGGSMPDARQASGGFVLSVSLEMSSLMPERSFMPLTSSITSLRFARRLVAVVHLSRAVRAGDRRCRPLPPTFLYTPTAGGAGRLAWLSYHVKSPVVGLVTAVLTGH